MKTGTIVGIDRKHAHVFTSDCRMVKLQWQPDMVVGKEIMMEPTNITPAPVARNRRLQFSLAAACLVLLLVVGLIFGQGLITSPVYATLSIDVNPSLELSLDRDLNVLSVKALNDDATQLLAGHNLTGLYWQDAVNTWAEILKASNQVQVDTMLISAVMPEDAIQLKTQLLAMEGTVNQGVLSNIEVRAIYSNDAALVGQASQNGLSIGRQMLLNQALVQNQNWDENSIENAPLGELIQNLLQNQEQNQTGIGGKTTQSAAEQTGASTGITETNRETNGSAQQTNGSQTNGSAQQTSHASSSSSSAPSSQSQQTSQIKQSSGH